MLNINRYIALAFIKVYLIFFIINYSFAFDLYQETDNPVNYNDLAKETNQVPNNLDQCNDKIKQKQALIRDLRIAQKKKRQQKKFQPIVDPSANHRKSIHDDRANTSAKHYHKKTHEHHPNTLAEQHSEPTHDDHANTSAKRHHKKTHEHHPNTLAEQHSEPTHDDHANTSAKRHHKKTHEHHPNTLAEQHSEPTHDDHANTSAKRHHKKTHEHHPNTLAEQHSEPTDYDPANPSTLQTTNNIDELSKAEQ